MEISSIFFNILTLELKGGIVCYFFEGGRDSSSPVFLQGRASLELFGNKVADSCSCVVCIGLLAFMEI